MTNRDRKKEKYEQKKEKYESKLAELHEKYTPPGRQTVAVRNIGATGGGNMPTSKPTIATAPKVNPTSGNNNRTGQDNSTRNIMIGVIVAVIVLCIIVAALHYQCNEGGKGVGNGKWGVCSSFYNPNRNNL